MQNAIDSTSPQRAEQIIRAAGFDGIKYTAKAINRGVGGYTKAAESTSWVVFDPAQIRPAA
jgi:hypothetical protein